MGKNYVESSLKRFLKRKVKVTLGLIVAFLITGSVGYAEINEKPIPGKNYNDFLVYNGELELTAGDYVFNFDGGLKLTGNKNLSSGILLGKDQTNNPTEDMDFFPGPNYKYDQVNAIFNIGKALNEKYDFSVTGSEMALHIAKKDSLTINGKETNLYFKSTSSDMLEYVGTILVNTEGKLDITANSMYIEGVDEANIRMVDNAKVNITLTDNYISQKGGTMIEAQNYLDNSDTVFNLTAANIISSSKKEGMIDYSMGIYSYNYNLSNSNITMNLIAKDKINILGYDYGMYSAGSANIHLKAQNINIAAAEYGLYLHRFSSDKSTTLTMGANGIDISGKQYGIYVNDRVEIDITGDTAKISSDYIGIYNLGGSVINSSAENIDISGKKWAIYNNASKVTLTGNDLININSSEGYGIVSTKENADVKLAGKVLNLTSSSGTNANTKGKINIETSENYITGNLRATTNGEILVSSNKNNVTGNILAETEGKVSINFNGGNSKLTGYSSLGDKSDGVVNLGLSNDAVWENTNNSEVTEFNLNSGIVKMSHAENGQDITIKKMTGNNGTFVMDISGNDISHGNTETDFINIKNADSKQTHFVQLNEKSIENLKDYDFSDKQNGIWFSDSNNNVAFKGKESSSLSNVFNYTPIIDTDIKDSDTSANGTNWYITGVEEKENEVPQTVIDDISFLYEAAISRLELDTLHKRMGEIRNYENAQGVWFRTSTGEMKSDVSDSSFENDYYILQVGYDKKKVSDKGNWFTGFAVSRRENDIDFRNGDGESENIGLSLYKSFAGKDNTYFDLIGKYTYLDTEYKVHNSNSEMKADYDTWAGTLSAEFGKKYSSKNDKWYITPHAQLNYTYVNGEDYRTSTDVKVEQDNIDSLIGRVGIYAGKDFEKSSHYLKLAVLNEFMGDYGATIKGADSSLTKKVNGDDTWTEVGIGGNFQVGNSGTTHIYYDIERTFGSRFETQWQGTLGFRISFNKLSDLFTSPVEAPVTIEAANLFDFDKSEVKAEGKEMIKNASEIMNAKKLKGILSIEGHTDWTGDEEYNQILSEKRAKAVEEVFKENVTNENIKYETKGYGETKPVADNKTKEGRAANRRVEMKFNKN